MKTKSQTTFQNPEVDFLIHAKWILPVLETDCPQYTTIYEQHSLAIKDNKIHAIVPTEEAKKYFTAKETLNLSTHLLMPGFINTHTHSAMVLFRGIADDLSLMDWLQHHIWPKEQQWVNAQFVEEGTEIAIAEMLLSGTTCFADMYFFPNEAARISKKSHIRSHFYCPIMEFPTNWAQTPDDYLAKAIDLTKMYINDPLIEIGLGPHAPYTVSDETFKKILQAREKHNLKVQIHLHETKTEVEDSLKNFGVRPIERLNQLGFIFPGLQAVHMTQLNDEEINLINERHVSIIHCPQSNLKLASGFCRTHDLAMNNVTIALGTDSASSNNDLDLLSEMQTAALIAKAVSLNPQAMPAIEAIKIATLNGAKALQLNDKIGSLEVGKEADLIAIDFNDISLMPCYNPPSKLVYSAIRHHVTHVWVQGKNLLHERMLTQLTGLDDMNELKNKAEKWQAKLR